MVSCNVSLTETKHFRVDFQFSNIFQLFKENPGLNKCREKFEKCVPNIILKNGTRQSL